MENCIFNNALIVCVCASVCMYARSTACFSRYFPTGILASASFVYISPNRTGAYSTRRSAYRRSKCRYPLPSTIFVVLCVGVYISVIRRLVPHLFIFYKCFFCLSCVVPAVLLLLVVLRYCRCSI